tara:strand:+ start:493 stop:930 length:438 start_codon:yes stop_codon:yes gene_type:complete
MALCTSGDWTVDSKKLVVEAVYKFMCDKFEVLYDADVIEVNQCDLTEDNVFGWCEVDGDGDFLIHIHNNLTPDPYITTLIHELVHVKQTLTGLLDDDRREEEANVWEKILTKEFWDTWDSGTFYHTPWSNRVYNKKVINKGGHLE